MLENIKNNKVIRNSYYGVIQFVVPTLLLLGFTPLFIHKMGTENYGLWMLATSALGLMGIAEFGLNTAIAKFVAEFVESGDSVAISTVVSAGLVVYFLLGFGLIIPMYVFSPYFAGILKPSEAISSEQITLVVRIISFGLIPLLFRSGALAVPIGLQRFQTPVIVIIAYQILSYTAALIVTLLGGTVAQVVSSTVIVLWITALGSLIVAWRMLKPFRLKFAYNRSGEILHRMFSFTVMSGLSSLGSQIFSFADRITVGVVLGLEGVAYYSVIIGVATKILQLSSALTSSLMPAVSTWMASGAILRVRLYFLRSTAVLVVINFLVVGFLLLLSAPLLRLWMGPEFADHVLVPFRILIVIYALISLNAPAFHVANGMGKPGINALAAISGGCFSIALIYLWGKTMGLHGTALANGGYLISLTIIGYVFLHINKVINLNSTELEDPEVYS